ncbi:unnamed protein product [Adineta steineri]|uniref:Uncharacterized protein n=1 Tax=Adineta steineri TaxID=433720 RepID=A0A814EQC3_9BILA|nr:unnamed protein product [Adineta steineri]
MGKGQSKPNASTVPKSAEGRRRINIQQAQNVLLIWLDSNIAETNDDCQNTIIKLRCIVNDINTFIDGDQCLEFIQTIVDKKVCMIISGSLGQHTVSRVHNNSALTSTNPTYCYKGTCQGGNYYYQAIQINVSVDGLQDILGNSSIYNSCFLYNDSFNATFPNKNLMLEYCFYPEDVGFRIIVFLQATAKYVLVVTTLFWNVTGLFSIITYGEGSVSFFNS